MDNMIGSAPLARLIPLAALALLASGCQPQVPATTPGNVDDMPLLVQFIEEEVDGKPVWCPKEVGQMVESCPADKKAAGKVCRGKDKKIVWVSVRGYAPPYIRDYQLPQFEIRFAGESPIKKDCKKSKDGVVDCRIDKDADSGEYKYDVVAPACKLDPRIYVE